VYTHNNMSVSCRSSLQSWPTLWPRRGIVRATPAASGSFPLSSKLETELAKKVIDRQALKMAVELFVLTERSRLQDERSQLMDERSQLQNERSQILERAHKAELQAQRTATEVLKISTVAKERGTELLRHYGLLNMRGVFEYHEGLMRMQPGVSSSTPRRDLWKAYLRTIEGRGLAECLSSVLDKFTEPEAALTQVYRDLSDGVHVSVAPGTLQDKVQIVEGPLSAKQCMIAKCMCEHFQYSYVLHLTKQVPDLVL